MSAVCRFIHAEKVNFTIVLLCRVMKTARSTYYAWVAGIEAREKRRRADEALAHEITGALTPNPEHGLCGWCQRSWW